MTASEEVEVNSNKENDPLKDQVEYKSWNHNHTKILIDLYGKYKKQLGTLRIKTMKKLWEIIANEINERFNLNVSPSNCENRWRVLDRNYKKFVENKNLTGRGRRCFEYAEEMAEIFGKKRNIHPEILLSSDAVIMPKISSAEPVETAVIATEIQEPSTSKHDSTETHKNILKKNKSRLLNKNNILESMRKDRLEYQKQRVKMEKEKLEIEKEKLQALKRRNQLIEDRNKLMKGADKIY